MSSGYRRLVPILLVLLSAAAFGQLSGSKGSPKARVDLVASVDRVVPGQPFDVLVRFRMDSGWHIYWQNPGDAGVAPRVSWNLPTGFAAGDLQFPVPTKHVAPGNIVTNVIEDLALLPVRMTPPESISLDKVTLAGDVRYLVCRESCLQESAKLNLALPIGKVGETAKAVNEDVFKAARKALPNTASKYLTIRPVDPPRTFSPNQNFELSVAVEVRPGFHIQSNKPLSSNFIAAELLMERVDGFYFEAPRFPEGKLRPVKTLGQISEYSGQVLVKIPGQAPEVPPSGPVRFGGLFHYQACNEQGNCFPPDTLAFSFVAGEARTDSGGDLAAPPVPAVASSTPVTPEVEHNGGGPPETAPYEIETAEEDAAGGPIVAPTFFGWLVAAFIGGLILNVMPCVLPVISIKVLSLVQQANEEPGRIFRLSMTFVLGIITSFVALAVVIVALKSTGQQLGWGFQFQSPMFIIAMTALIFLFGLSLFGVFEITLPGTAVDHLAAAESREGYTGAFMKGLLGTILATPCTAPYLGGALGWAFTSATTTELLAVFATVGLGMASPFLVLAMKPGWLRFLPRPGAWMETFKQFMGFLLMGTVIWLMFPLGHLIGPRGLILTMIFLTFLGLAAWLIGRQTPLTPVGRRLGAWALSLAIVAGGWWTAFGRPRSSLAHLTEDYQRMLQGVCELSLPERSEFSDHIPWQPWSKGLAEKLATQGHTVYIDYTAAWCVTCLANKHATLETDAVRRKMAENCVVPLKADFTNENPEILEELNRFGRAGVPTNVIFPAGKPNKPILLPEQLVGRTGLVLKKLDNAGASLRCRTALTSR